MNTPVNTDWYHVRFPTTEELLKIARAKRMVIRHNSLVGSFAWTPDAFELERRAASEGKRGPSAAAFSVENYWAQPLDEFVGVMERERLTVQARLKVISDELQHFSAFIGGSISFN
jgi:hypothetical protein